KPMASRRTDHRVDPLPERRLLSCDGGVPSQWPAVPYSYDAALEGLGSTLLGYLQRADGSRQLTISGCPLYRYLGDRKPGQVNGHGAGGVWFAATPAGQNPTRPPR